MFNIWNYVKIELVRHRISFSQTRFLVDLISYLRNTTLTTICMLASTLLFVHQIFGIVAKDSFVL